MRTLREQLERIENISRCRKTAQPLLFLSVRFPRCPPPSLGLGLRPTSSGLYKGAHFSKSAVREQGAVREQEPFGSRVIQ